MSSSHQRFFYKKGVLKNFTKFTGKHLWQRFFFNKVAGRLLYFSICQEKNDYSDLDKKFRSAHSCYRPVVSICNFIKKETLARVYSCEFYEISKNTFLTEHLWETASGNLQAHLIKDAPRKIKTFRGNQKTHMNKKPHYNEKTATQNEASKMF